MTSAAVWTGCGLHTVAASACQFPQGCGRKVPRRNCGDTSQGRLLVAPAQDVERIEIRTTGIGLMTDPIDPTPPLEGTLDLFSGKGFGCQVAAHSVSLRRSPT